MSERYEWAVRSTLNTGEVRTTEKPAGEADARRSYDESALRLQRNPGKVVKVELLSRPVGPWGVVNSAEVDV